jgi:hypothetical protein
MRPGISSRFCCIAALAVLAAGCGKGIGAKPVSGKVTYPDGTPVVGARVVFDSPDLKSNAEATTDEQGVYQLTTQDPNDGAIPGKYRAIVMHQSLDGKSKLDKKYSDYATSGLEFTVGEDGGIFPIQVEPAGTFPDSGSGSVATRQKNSSRTLADAKKDKAGSNQPELPEVKDPSVLAKLPFLGRKSS